jgi:multidrug transporter EmrE-like cation transporter
MGYVFLVVALTLNATANLLLKAGAERIGPPDEPIVARLLTNYHLLSGLVLFALNVVFYVAALTRLNLSVAYPVMMAGALLIVVCVSIVSFGDSLSAAQGIGIACLLVGLVLVTHRAAA